jgi:hypothetical protein
MPQRRSISVYSRGRFDEPKKIGWDGFIVLFGTKNEYCCTTRFSISISFLIPRNVGIRNEIDIEKRVGQQTVEEKYGRSRKNRDGLGENRDGLGENRDGLGENRDGLGKIGMVQEK